MNLVVRDLSCQYGTVPALRGVSLDVRSGEIVVLLGPSGSGKTTLLSLVAGLLTPSGGEIRVGDEVLSRPDFVRAPEDRHIGFVFQDFALWPHMTVEQTVEFPLKMGKTPRAMRRRRVEDVLKLVHLDGLGARYPHELSGGQRQRVAIARALAPRPQLVLLDEPMSNLDARLREQMRGELQDVLRHEGVTALYVTHDRLEALAPADRLAIVDDGRLVQVGTPKTVYDAPASVFAAGFIGPAAMLPVEVLGSADGGGVRARLGNGVPVTGPGLPFRHGHTRGTWIIRPERLRVVQPGSAPSAEVVLPAVVRSSIYAGSHWQLELGVLSGSCAVTAYHSDPIARGDTVQLAVDAARTWIIPEEDPRRHPFTVLNGAAGTELADAPA